MSLMSRKFLLAAAGVLTGIANNEIELVMASIVGYMAAEGGADIVERNQKAKLWVDQESQRILLDETEPVSDGEMVSGKSTIDTVE